MIVPDPLGFLDKFRNSNRYRNWRPWSEHGASQGHLLQSALTGKIMSGFQYDHRWSCPECRVYKEEQEGGRIVKAFGGHQMWLTVVRGTRGEATRAVAQPGVRYVMLPLDGSSLWVALTSGSVGCDSVRIDEDDKGVFVRGTLMPMRWEGTISSTRGFLPPAREYDYFEAYHKDTRRRCWHLHESREEAAECPVPLELDGERRGWYVRGCSANHRVGRVKVHGDALVDILQTCRLGFVETHQGEGTVLVLDPVRWDDDRFRRFLAMAQWEPPHPGFQPPPLVVRVQVDTLRGRMGGAAVDR